MLIRGREKAALILCLLWVIVAVASFYFIEFAGTFEQDLFRGQKTFWIMIIFSLLILILGLVIFFGKISIIFPYIFLSEEDLSGYNVGKISFLLGILMVALSYVFTFVTIGKFAFWMALFIAAAIAVGAFYTLVSKKFEANT
jgi:uncharacterized RDD family membrane protein YckC